MFLDNIKIDIKVRVIEKSRECVLGFKKEKTKLNKRYFDSEKCEIGPVEVFGYRSLNLSLANYLLVQKGSKFNPYMWIIKRS